MQSTFSTALPPAPADSEARERLVERYLRVRDVGAKATIDDELYALFQGTLADAERRIANLESLRVAAPQAPEPNVRRVRPPAVRFRDARRTRHV